MVHVLIDSSIYRKRRKLQLRHLAFKTLAGLCEKKLVILHVPSIVRRELTTHLALEAEEVLTEAVRAVKRLLRSGGPDNERRSVEGALRELDSFKGRYGEYAAQNFDRWLRKVNAIEHEVRSECLHDVLDQYFEGKLPFKSIKSRDDFPDAFVWQIIKDLATKQQPLYAIVADNNLRKAASQIAGVETFESLVTFIESPTIQDLFPENFVRKHEVEILNLFKYNAWVFDEPVAEGIEAELLETSILHTVYDNQDEADIVEIEAVHDLKIEFGAAQYFGENVFRIPFEAVVSAVLDYFLMKSTYLRMSHEETILIEVQDSEWNESTMWVREGRKLNVRGELAVSIDITELIKKSAGAVIDTDTVLYGSDITVDELDPVEIG